MRFIEEVPKGGVDEHTRALMHTLVFSLSPNSKWSNAKGIGNGKGGEAKGRDFEGPESSQPLLVFSWPFPSLEERESE